MDNNAEPLLSAEYKAIGQGIFAKIADYDKLPYGVELDYQSCNGINHIGFTTTAGGKYLQKYVTGGFEAQLPFQIAYMIAPTNNGQNMDAEEFMDELAEYMQDAPFPELTGGREVEEIIMDSITYHNMVQENGAVIYVRTGILKYEKI